MSTAPDRSQESPAEPCARHDIAALFIVRASVCEGTEPRHLVEYINAHLTNRAPDLHEDIYDELEGLTMQVTGHEIRLELASLLFEGSTCPSCAGRCYDLTNHEALCGACQGQGKVGA